MALLARYGFFGVVLVAAYSFVLENSPLWCT